MAGGPGRSVVLKNPIFGLALFMTLAISLAGCSTIPVLPVVTVENGALSGVSADGVYSFKGIPYAAPPTGELRWRAPRAAADWQGVRPATDYAPHCAQPLSKQAWFDQQPMSEDCLALNVWTPELQPDEPLPVMVWIHGGGYTLGSGNVARSNGAALAAQGVVQVSINYRLSVFGFMAHPAIEATQPEEVQGNFGLQDTVAALRWVRQNIAAFGGDPNRVTVFGESAGAGVVNTLLVVPEAEGLFQRAISQSSSVGLAPDPYPDRRAGFLQPGHKGALQFAKRLDIDEAGSDADVAESLRAASMENMLAVITDNDRYTPVVDGVFLPDQVGALLRDGRQHRVNYITGGNSWEASLGRGIGGGFSPEFSAKLLTAAQKASLYPGLTGEVLEDAIFGDLIVHSGSTYVARQMSAAGLPVYRYYLSYLLEDRRGRQPGVAHADDIAYVMQTLDNEPDLESISARDREVGALLTAYWASFARSGNPNHEDAPQWPLFDSGSGMTLEISDSMQVHDGLFAERMNFHIQRGTDLMNGVRK
jgi:para-nitrobenzyl esterase